MPFLSKQYAVHRFIRKTPVKLKPGPRPPDRLEQDKSQRARPGHGRTGRSLAKQIEVTLSNSLKVEESCDLILVIDDLDCQDSDVQRELFDKTIRNVEGAADIRSYVGFASPEIEAWIVADWENTIATDSAFRGCVPQMRHWLSTQRSVPFDSPETFSHFDPNRDSCHEKVSDTVVESSIQCCAQARYSKGIHTARFLRRISPEVVSGKCPFFRGLHHRLTQTE
jgi:hypothetical protein